MSIKSPFDAKHTLLLDPRFTTGYSVFLYKSDMPGTKNSYDIKLRQDWGTLGIHANTRASYYSAFNYICSIYGMPNDEDDECVLWEMDSGRDDAWVDGEIYQTEAATWNDE